MIAARGESWLDDILKYVLACHGHDGWPERWDGNRSMYGAMRGLTRDEAKTFASALEMAFMDAERVYEAEEKPVPDIERKSWWRPQPRGPIIATRRGAVIIVLRLRGPVARRYGARTVAAARMRFDALDEAEAERMVGGEE